MIQSIIFATKNQGKLIEIKKILTAHNIICMTQAGYDQEIIEDGNSYKENAAKKAKTIAQASGLPTLADDSGIEIEFFDNKPAVHSSTFLTTNQHYKQRNKKILELMKNATNRSAKYVCTIALFIPQTNLLHFTSGELVGTIATQPTGTNGFAYDEIFFVNQYNTTVANITIDQKNEISHRNIALQKMSLYLREIV